MQGWEWFFDAEVSPGLWRVFSSREVKWFVPEAEPGCGPGRAARAVGPDMEPVDGLLIERCQGGLLIDAVRGLAPLDAEHIVCLLRSILRAVSDARLALSRRSLALTEDGQAAAVPGIGRRTEEREARELGEILYAAAEGAEFSSTAVPLARRESALPDDLVELIDALLLDEAPDPLPRGDLLAAVEDMPAATRLPFYPGEAGIAVDDAPTAGLPAAAAVPAGGGDENDSVRRLRGADALDCSRSSERRMGGSQREERGAVARLRGGKTKGEAVRSKTEAWAARRGGDWLKTVTRPRTAAIAGCALVIGIGAVLLVGLGDDPADEPGAGGGEAAAAIPTAEAGEQAEAGEGASAENGPAAEEDGGEGDPCAGFERLTQQRAEVFASGDADRLDALSTPGSPAAEVDAKTAAEGIAPSKVTMTVDECTVVREASESAQLTAAVTTALDEERPSTARLRVELAKTRGEWTVSRAVDLD